MIVICISIDSDQILLKLKDGVDRYVHIYVRFTCMTKRQKMGEHVLYSKVMYALNLNYALQLQSTKTIYFLLLVFETSQQFIHAFSIFLNEFFNTGPLK